MPGREGICRASGSAKAVFGHASGKGHLTALFVMPGCLAVSGTFGLDRLVKLPTHTPEDIFNGNHKQLRGGKGNAVHQQTTNFIYMITRPEIARRTDRGTIKLSES